MESQRKRKGMNRKGVLGLDIVRSFLVFILFLAVIAVGIFAAVVTVSDKSVVPEEVVNGGTLNTTMNLTYTGVYPVGINRGRSITYGSIYMTANDTDNNYPGTEDDSNTTVFVSSGNYTTNSSGAFFSTTGWDNSTVRVVVGYNYNLDSGAIGIRTNLSNATTQFFNNIPVIFAILGVVMIILAVSLIILVVRRFGGRSSEGL